MPGSRPSPGRLTPKLICTRAHPHLDALNSPVDPLPGSLATEGFSISRNLTCALLLALPLPPRNLSPAAHLEPSVLVYPERENRLGGWKDSSAGNVRTGKRQGSVPARNKLQVKPAPSSEYIKVRLFSLALGFHRTDRRSGRGAIIPLELLRVFFTRLGARLRVLAQSAKSRTPGDSWLAHFSFSSLGTAPIPLS